MNTATNNTSKATTNQNVKTSSSVAQMTISLIGGASLLIGLWAVACFIGALAGNGPMAMIKGFISAVTGM
ncbi:MAG: hypothetical protein KJ950_12320 [Proteobacteria bacterium]|nr:hypothetical protein [Pseudomonadota bacterium]MBU1687610.1 hypothetical protein [Pseudomonadota bacterium]